ncbi:MAG: SCO1664 family protein [Acidimicrobiia bacterium]
MVTTSDLSDGQIELTEIIGEFVAASNLTLLATDAAGAKWVYKAERAMTELWDFDATTLPRREVAAFVLSEALGFDLIPLTALATGPLGPGSAQRFVEVDETFDPRPLFVPEVSDALWPLAVLDILSNNADRKLGHLLSEREKLWAIDNGLSFHPEPKLRTVLWGFAGRRVPDQLLKAVASVEVQLGSGLDEELLGLIDKRSVAALRQRAQDLLTAGTHPFPPIDRPAMPWPVW